MRNPDKDMIILAVEALKQYQLGFSKPTEADILSILGVDPDNDGYTQEQLDYALGLWTALPTYVASFLCST